MLVRPSNRLVLIGVLVLAAFAAILAGLGVKRARERVALATALAGGGDPRLGPDLMRQYGCASCHQVRGVRGPGGRVGPPLTTINQRVYVAGMLTNTPDNLLRWIVDPKSVNPKTAMPVTGISTAQARHVVAYLLSL